MSSAKQPPGYGGRGHLAAPGAGRIWPRPTPPMPRAATKSGPMDRPPHPDRAKPNVLPPRPSSRPSGSVARPAPASAPATTNGHGAASQTGRSAQPAPAARPPRPTARPLPPRSPSPSAPGSGKSYPALKAIPLAGAAAAADPKPITPRSPRAALQPEDMPMPPRRSRAARRPFVIAANAMLALILLAMVGSGIAFVVGKQRFELPGPLAADKVVNIPRGGIRETADLLMREGVIDQPNLFIAGALVLKAQNDLKYGEYKFPRNASLRDVVDTLIEGKVVQHAFTVAEGQTSEKIAQRLIDNEMLSGGITFGTTREQIIQRMRQAQRAVQEIWERRNIAAGVFLLAGLAVCFALVLLAVLAVRRADPNEMKGALWGGGGGVLLTSLLFGHVLTPDVVAERRAIEARASELAARAMAPGSALSCLDSVSAPVEIACEKALFATPEAVGAAVAYVEARYSLLVASAALAARDPSYQTTVERLRRGLEEDRLGVLAQVFFTRGCSTSDCADFAVLRDSRRIIANMKGQVFAAHIAAHGLAWNSAPVTPPSGTAVSPPLVREVGTTVPTTTSSSSGETVRRRYVYPSPDQIPAISIMDPEVDPPGAEAKPAPQKRLTSGRDVARDRVPAAVAPPAHAPAVVMPQTPVEASGSR